MSDIAWIDVIEEREAEGDLAETYRVVKGRRGKVANVLKVHSLHPEALRAHLDLYLTLMFGRATLSRPQRELIGVVVSATNECAYCVEHHAQALDHYWKDRARVDRVAHDVHDAGLEPAEVAMLEYAIKLTRTPASSTAQDVQALREVGFDDRAILEANQIVAYFNFVNRLVLGLGVRDDAEEAAGYHY